MTEEWRPMVDHPKFLVSNKGRVASVFGKVFKTWVNHKGYEQVALSEFGKQFTVKVHREVAKAFLPQEEGKDQINHIDGNKLNNEVSNLEWCTAKENTNHAYHVLMHTNEPRGEKPVKCIETGITYRSMTEAQRQTGCKRSCIWKSCTNPEIATKGFHWEYVNEDEEETK